MPLYLRDSTAKKRFDAVEAARGVSVNGLSLLDAELRGSVTMSQASKRLGSPLHLELVYVSKTNNIFTDDNLAAIKALEDRIRNHAEYEQFCARDWSNDQLVNASLITTDHPMRDAMNAKLPPCKTMNTALQACADKNTFDATCGATRVTALPAGLLDCKKQTASKCGFDEMTLDMDFVNARLAAYSKNDPGTNASAALNTFYTYPSDNFGSGISESASLRSTFTFGLPLEGYLHSQDRPQEQEDKVWKFVYESYHGWIEKANAGDLSVHYSCAAPDACSRLHLVKKTYLDGFLISLGVVITMIFVAVRQGSLIIGLNTVFHFTSVFAGAYMMFAVWQQRAFGLFSIISAFAMVMSTSVDTALAGDLWRGAAAAGAGAWTGWHQDPDDAKAARHQQRTVVSTRLLPLMGAGAAVSFGAALACLASDFPAVRSFGLFSAAIALVNFCVAAVSLPAVLAVAYQDLGYFPFCGCLGTVTAVRPPSSGSNGIAHAEGDDGMAVMVVPSGAATAAPGVAPGVERMSGGADMVVPFKDHFPPADLTDPAARAAAREVFDEAKKEREAAEAARTAAAAKAAEAEAETQKMDKAVREAEAELATMAQLDKSEAAVRADTVKVTPEVQATVDNNMVTNKFLEEEEIRAKMATQATAQRRQEAAALQKRLETEMKAARAATEAAAKEAAAARARAEVMAATSAASAIPPSAPPAAAAPPGEGPLPGSLRAGATSKRPGRPGRKSTPPGTDGASGSSSGPGPVTESTQVPPDMEYHSPQKPGKPSSVESSSTLMEAMARMHKAQSDVILATSGTSSGAPASFGAVYAALLDRFKWGVVIAIAVCMGVLLATAISVDAAFEPPHLFPPGDNFREVHAARTPYYSRGGSSNYAMRTRMVWGINPSDPIFRGHYPRETNPTKLGDVGRAKFANATRLSVGAKCFLHLCDTAEVKDSGRATGGISAGYHADCWMRDFKKYVDSVANTTDQCGHKFAFWNDITGCPSTCDCAAGYGISNGDGAGTNRACRLQIEAQEKKWWEAIYAFLRDVPGNFDKYAPKILGEKMGSWDHQRMKEVLREVRQCPSDATGALHWRYTHADVPLTSADNVPAKTGLKIERAWEAWWGARYADAQQNECRKVSAMWQGFVYTPQTERWTWQGTSPSDWFNAMDAVMLDVTKVVIIAHIIIAALVTLMAKSLVLGVIAGFATAVAESFMVSFVVLRGARVGAIEAIVLCITPAAVAPFLTHAAVAYAACALPARSARVRAMLLESGAAPLTAAVATMCVTGAPLWGFTNPVKEASVYMFVLAFGAMIASAVFAGIVAAARPGHGLLGNCIKGETDDSVRGGGQRSQTTGAKMMALPAPPPPETNGGAAGATMALPSPEKDENAVTPFSPQN